MLCRSSGGESRVWQRVPSCRSRALVMNFRRGREAQALLSESAEDGKAEGEQQRIELSDYVYTSVVQLSYFVWVLFLCLCFFLSHHLSRLCLTKIEHDLFCDQVCSTCEKPPPLRGVGQQLLWARVLVVWLMVGVIQGRFFRDSDGCLRRIKA